MMGVRVLLWLPALSPSKCWSSRGQAMGMGTGTALHSQGCTAKDRAALGMLLASEDVPLAQPRVSESAQINK